MYKHKKNGYSIVEILVYLAIFTSLSVLVINSFITILATFDMTRSNRDLLESGATAMERISREIRQAESVDVPNSTLGSTPGILELDSTNSGGTPVAIRFVTSSGALNLYEEGTLIGNLLGQNISVTNLVFRRIITTNGEALKVELTIQDTSTKVARSENFYNTIILRGQY
jgi:type II secretory pathway pseudopilin PulG